MNISEPPGDERIRNLLHTLFGSHEKFDLEFVPSHSYVCRKACRGTEALSVKIAMNADAECDLLRGAEAQRLAVAARAQVPAVVAVAATPNEFGHAYIIQHWIHGQTAAEFLQSADVLDIAALARSIGRNVALIHRAVTHFDAGERRGRLHAGNWRSECARRLASRARACEASGNIGPDVTAKIAARCERLLEALEPAVAGLVHGDLHMRNLIVAGRSLEAVLDFDRADLGDPLMDFVKLDATLFSECPPSFASFIKAYGEIRPGEADWPSRIYLYQGIEYLSAASLLHLFPEEAERYQKLIRRWLANSRYRWEGPDST